MVHTSINNIIETFSKTAVLSLTTYEYMAHHRAHYIKIWLHPQNWKCIMYCNTAKEGMSHGHGQHAQKVWWSSVKWFPRYASRQTDTQIEQTHASQYLTALLQVKYKSLKAN